MPGLLSAMEGFCVIGIVIATGYVAARMRIGGPTAQMVLNRFSFFVSSPCLMFAILSKEKIFEIFHSSIVVAFFSAVLVGVVFLILNRLFFHMKAADATIGALNSLYLKLLGEGGLRRLIGELSVRIGIRLHTLRDLT